MQTLYFALDIISYGRVHWNKCGHERLLHCTHWEIIQTSRNSETFYGMFIYEITSDPLSTHTIFTFIYQPQILKKIQ